MSDLAFTLTVFGVLSVLLLSFSIYVQRPRFGSASPRSIEVVVYRPFSSEIAYQANISDRASCQKVLQELRLARFTFFGFKPTGVLNIQYDDGRVDHLRFTRCNDGTHSLIFRVFYEMPSKQFYHALQEAGVDVRRFESRET